MRLAIKGSEQSVAEMRDSYGNWEWIEVNSNQEVSAIDAVAAYFQLDTDACKDDYTSIRVPVFIHAVSDTLQQVGLQDNVVRVNGWPGFLKRKNWEIAGNISSQHETVLASLGIQICQVSDMAGFLAARVLCMIINEAYFALEEGVSTKEDIDIAMKLGTGYPMGPFEWAEKIGIQEVVKLLNTLNENNSIYRPCTMLLQQL